MIIYLSGPNDYARHTRERSYLTAFQKKYGSLAAERFDLATPGALESFQEFARSVSMFQPAKLALLQNVFASETPVLIEELQRFLTTNQETTILVSEAKAAPANFAFLKKAETVELFAEPAAGAAWDDFIRSEAKTRGVRLSAEAGRFLATVFAGDPWRLATELDKLAHLDRPMIHRRDLDALGLEITPNFFGLTMDLRSRSLATRLAALDGLISSNEPGARAFYTVAYQWPEQLERLARADAAVKMGRYEYEEALLEAVLA